MKKVCNLDERLSALLDMSGVPDSSVADAINVSRQALSSWRTGVRVPKENAINALADYFKVDPVWLMGYDVPAQPEAAQPPDPRRISDEDLRFALWGGDADEITQAQLDEVRNFAAFIRERDKK